MKRRLNLMMRSTRPMVPRPRPAHLLRNLSLAQATTLPRAKIPMGGASVTVPVLKLVGLMWLLVSVQRGSTSRLRDRTALYRIVEAVGRWSMIDIFMLSILVALVRLGAIAKECRHAAHADDAPAFHVRDVMHTARRTRPSVGQSLDEDVALRRDLLAQRRGRLPGKVRLGVARRRDAHLAQALIHAIEEYLARRLGDVHDAHAQEIGRAHV